MTLASIIQQPPLAFERVAEMLLAAVVLTALATVLLVLLRTGGATGIRWMRHRRSSLAPGESMFVARWGAEGPELFVVGEGVRRLSPPHRCRANARRCEAGEIASVLAARMLREILGRPPSRDLTWAFVDERLGYLPVDGFALPAADVVAWLDARHAATSELGSRAAGAAGACAAFVASWFRRATRPPIEDSISRGRIIP